MEYIPQDPMFQACHFTDCTILIGGNITDQTISKIFGETTLLENFTVKDLRKGKDRVKSNWLKQEALAGHLSTISCQKVSCLHLKLVFSVLTLISNSIDCYFRFYCLMF